MVSLRTLQRYFADSVLHPNKPMRIAAHLAADAETLARRLAIYRNNYVAALRRTLTKTYPVCRKLVGDDFFNGLVAAYIDSTPSQAFSLDDYGASLDTFIASFAPTQSLPYLADVGVILARRPIVFR